MVSSESGTETGMCDVTVAVQFVYLWSGKRGKRLVLGGGLNLVDRNDSEWELNRLLFADDAVVVADSERKL